MEGTTSIIGQTTEVIGDLLEVGTTTLSTLMQNEYVMVFFGFSVLMFGFHIIHSIRKTF